MIEHINAQSLMGSMDEIKLLMKESSIDILCISEAWLIPSVPDHIVNIHGYRIFRCENGRGGGAFTYVRDDLSATAINLSVPKQAGVKDVWVTVQCRKLPSVIVGCMYRHPNTPNVVLDNTQDVLRTICMKDKAVYVLGDFNDNMFANNNKINNIIKK